MQVIKAIIRTDRLEAVIDGLHALPNMPGVTVSSVCGFGRRASGAGAEVFDQADFTKLEAVVDDESVRSAGFAPDSLGQEATEGGALCRP
jgi:nitrogen regulatory protein PII